MDSSTPSSSSPARPSRDMDVDVDVKEGHCEPAVASPAPATTLSAADRKAFNAMAEHMDYYHEHFRQLWRSLERLCASEKSSSKETRASIASIGLRFCSQLTMHHSIEEQFIFPVLAKRMPKFGEQGSLTTQHEGIHAGLDKFHDYLRQCSYGERELDAAEVKQLMSSFGTVLWAHLDDEVKELGAENMSKYWTKQEIQKMPM